MKRWIIALAIVLAVSLSVYMNGTMTWTSDDGTYSGQVKWGTRHGKGTLIAKDGTRYTSTWVDGYAIGPGELLLPDGKKMTGIFNLKEKSASIQLNDGSKYEGGFENNKFNGKGTLIRPNGAKYEGEFRDGKKNGAGILHMFDGSKYEGEFRDDDYYGKGTISQTDGTIIKGNYVKGNLDGIVTKYTKDPSVIFVTEYQNGRIVVPEKELPSIVMDSMIVKSNTGIEQPFRKGLLQEIEINARLQNKHTNGVSLELDVFYAKPYNKSYPQRQYVNGENSSLFSSRWKFDEAGKFVSGNHEIHIYWKDLLLGKVSFYVE